MQAHAHPRRSNGREKKASKGPLTERIVLGVRQCCNARRDMDHTEPHKHRHRFVVLRAVCVTCDRIWGHLSCCSSLVLQVVLGGRRVVRVFCVIRVLCRQCVFCCGVVGIVGWCGVSHRVLLLCIVLLIFPVLWVCPRCVAASYGRWVAVFVGWREEFRWAGGRPVHVRSKAR